MSAESSEQYQEGSIDKVIDIYCTECVLTYNCSGKFTFNGEVICCCYQILGHKETNSDGCVKCCSICQEIDILRTTEPFWNLDSAVCQICHYHVTIRYLNVGLFYSLHAVHEFVEANNVMENNQS